MNFELNEEQRQFRDLIHDFVAREVKTRAREVDENAEFNWEAVRKMGPIGLLGLEVPMAYGGAEVDAVSAAIAVEELGWGCGSTALAIAAHNGLCLAPLVRFGDEAQKEKWVRPLATGEGTQGQPDDQGGRYNHWGGRIGLTPFPGRWRLFGFIGAEPDGVLDDLKRIREWGAGLVISLVEEEELRFLGVDDMGPLAARAGLDWLHLPIPDFRAPGSDFEAGWHRHGPQVHRRLANNEAIVIHCLAGLGRTGTVAARVLIEHGQAPAAAIASVRLARPGAIQSQEQEDYLLALDCRASVGTRA